MMINLDEDDLRMYLNIPLKDHRRSLLRSIYILKTMMGISNHTTLTEIHDIIFVMSIYIYIYINTEEYDVERECMGTFHRPRLRRLSTIAQLVLEYLYNK